MKLVKADIWYYLHLILAYVGTQVRLRPTGEKFQAFRDGKSNYTATAIEATILRRKTPGIIVVDQHNNQFCNLYTLTTYVYHHNTSFRPSPILFRSSRPLQRSTPVHLSYHP